MPGEHIGMIYVFFFFFFDNLRSLGTGHKLRRVGGGGLQNGRGAREVLPLRKGGREKF